MSFKDDLLNQGNLSGILERKRLEEKARGGAHRTDAPFSTGPGRMAEAQDRKALLQQIQDLREQLAKSTVAGNAVLRLDELHEQPDRRRNLPAEKYAELKENLRNNETTTPITVIARPAGGYEIVSGHNRVAIYRELGRETIPAYIRTGEGDQQFAQVNAFYANLLQFGLSDWEKFEGFKMIQESFPDRTQEEIASQSGLSASFISQLMSFGDLPEAAKDLIKADPFKIGANAAQDLATLSKDGRAEQVTKAVEALFNGKVNQQQAVSMASTDPKKKVPEAKPEPVKVKIGRAVYCDLRQAKNCLRLEFRTEEEAAVAKAAVKLALEKLVEKNEEELKKTSAKET